LPPATARGAPADHDGSKTFRLALAPPADHLASQHSMIRVTAPDGHTASRSYSVASAPEASAEVEVTVEHLAGGELSTLLLDIMAETCKP